MLFRFCHDWLWYFVAWFEKCLEPKFYGTGLCFHTDRKTASKEGKREVLLELCKRVTPVPHVYSRS